METSSRHTARSPFVCCSASRQHHSCDLFGWAEVPSRKDWLTTFRFEIAVAASEGPCSVDVNVCESAPANGSALVLQTPHSFLPSSGTWIYRVGGDHLRRAGAYEVSVSTYRSSDMSWRPVRFSPFSFNVEAANANVNASSVGAPTSLSAPAGDAVSVPVTVLDVHGNARAPARGELAVSFVSSPEIGRAHV